MAQARVVVGQVGHRVIHTEAGCTVVVARARVASATEAEEVKVEPTAAKMAPEWAESTATVVAGAKVRAKAKAAAALGMATVRSVVYWEEEEMARVERALAAED